MKDGRILHARISRPSLKTVLFGFFSMALVSSGMVASFF